MVNDLEVEFMRNEAGEIKGTVVYDPRPVSGAARIKIVFISGYRQELSSGWQGPLPQNGERWLCDEKKDTRPEDPRGGAILVKLKSNLAQNAADALREERTRLAPIFDWLLDGDSFAALTDDQRLDLACSLRLLARRVAQKLGQAEAMKFFSGAAKKSFTDLHASLLPQDEDLARHPTWQKISDFDARPQVQLNCLEAIVAWLGAVRRSGDMIGRFRYLGARTYICPACAARICMGLAKWKEIATAENSKLKCPVCDTVAGLLE